MTPKEKYQLVVEAAGIDNEQLWKFLGERGLHSEYLTIWDQELREMIDKNTDKRFSGVESPEKEEHRALKRAVAQRKSAIWSSGADRFDKKLDAITEGHKDDWFLKNTR